MLNCRNNLKCLGLVLPVLNCVEVAVPSLYDNRKTRSSGSDVDVKIAFSDQLRGAAKKGFVYHRGVGDVMVKKLTPLHHHHGSACSEKTIDSLALTDAVVFVEKEKRCSKQSKVLGDVFLSFQLNPC